MAWVTFSALLVSLMASPLLSLVDRKPLSAFFSQYSQIKQFYIIQGLQFPLQLEDRSQKKDNVFA